MLHFFVLFYVCIKYLNIQIKKITNKNIFFLTYVWVSCCPRRSASLEPVEDRTFEGGRRPRSAHVGAHVGRIRAVIRPAETASAVMIPPVSRDVQWACVRNCRLPGRGHSGGQRRAGGESEAWRHRRVVVWGHRVCTRLCPSRVARRGAALLRRTGRLKVGQRRNHGGDDPGSGNINRRSARRGVMEKSGLVRRGSVVACHYALVHILTLELDIRVDEGKNGADTVTRGTAA